MITNHTNHTPSSSQSPSMATHRRVGVLIAGAALLLLGTACKSNSSAPDTMAPDSGPTEAGAGGPWTFSSSDTGKDTQAVVLKLDTLDGDKVWLKVVARGISKLQGVAFRLSTDPTAVKLIKAEAGTAWGSTTTTSKFVGQSDGEIWGGVGHVGAKGIDASKETTVARLQLSATGAGKLTLSFRAQHNLVLDSSGAKVTAAWLGGTLSR